MIVIGVVGNQGASAVTKIIKEELKRKSNVVWQVNGGVDNENFNKLEDNKPDYLLVKLNHKRIKKHSLEHKIFDVVVYVNYDSNNLILSSANEVTSAIKNNGYLIYNSENFVYENIEHDNIHKISCGINSKNTTTVSSIDDTLTLNFRYCLQKYLLDQQNKLIEPFESCITTDRRLHNTNVNYYLAAYTCIMVLGYKI